MEIEAPCVVKIVNGEIVRKVKLARLTIEELRSKVREVANCDRFVLVLLDANYKGTPVHSQQELEEAVKQPSLGPGVLRVSFTLLPQPQPQSYPNKAEPEAAEEAEKKKKILERLERGRDSCGSRLAFLQELRKLKEQQGLGPADPERPRRGMPEFLRERLQQHKKRSAAKSHVKELVSQLFAEHTELEEDVGAQEYVFAQAQAEMLAVLRRHAVAAQLLTPAQREALTATATGRAAEHKARRRECWRKAGERGSGDCLQQLSDSFERPAELEQPQPHRGFDYPHIEESFMLVQSDQQQERDSFADFGLNCSAIAQRGSSAAENRGADWF